MKPVEYPELPVWMTRGPDAEPFKITHHDTMVRLFSEGWQVCDAPKPHKETKAEREARADGEAEDTTRPENPDDEAKAKPDAKPAKTDTTKGDTTKSDHAATKDEPVPAPEEAPVPSGQQTPTTPAKTESTVIDDGKGQHGDTDHPDSPTHRRSSGR